MKRLTTEQFIEKARLIHSDKYDYSKVVYKNNYTKIIITCPKHGDFLQAPGSHLSGCGCPECRNDKLREERAFTTEEFIRRARLVHGDKYNYSKVNYVNNNTKVEIICPIHGSFWMKPNNHLNGQNCPLCMGKFEHTTEWFIERAKEVHGDKYDYSKVNYVASNIKVKIICKKCGTEFEQTPEHHIQGEGCPYCKYTTRLTKEIFIERSRKLFGDYYDYSKVNYINNNTKVTIICPVHGEFEQLPRGHMYGVGCRKCGQNTLTKEQFIVLSKEKFGDKFDYSKVEFVNNNTPVILKCNDCGYEFKVVPKFHLKQKVGCRKCLNHLSLTVDEFIEKAKEVHGDYYDYSKVTEIKNNSTPVTIICKTCGTEFQQAPYRHLKGFGCFKCSGRRPSRGEMAIMRYLDKIEEPYIFQKRFLSCRKIYPLPFDFYLPNRNYCIEYQGKQHDIEVEYFGGKQGFIDRKIADKIKKSWCLKPENPDLLEITYKQSITEELDKFFDEVFNEI